MDHLNLTPRNHGEQNMHFLVSIIVFFVIIRIFLRMLGLRGHRHRHLGYGHYDNGFAYNRGSRRGGGLFTLLGLIALDRLFTRRW